MIANAAENDRSAGERLQDGLQLIGLGRLSGAVRTFVRGFVIVAVGTDRGWRRGG